MPLTNTLDTARRIESLGFTHQQAQGFAELLEETAQATQQDLKSFIREQLAALEGRLETKFSGTDVKFAGLEVKLAELRAEMHSSQRDLAFKLIAALVAVASLAVAIIKLFPNVH